MDWFGRNGTNGTEEGVVGTEGVAGGVLGIAVGIAVGRSGGKCHWGKVPLIPFTLAPAAPLRNHSPYALDPLRSTWITKTPPGSFFSWIFHYPPIPFIHNQSIV
jgi:hypothetical protein